ncbi:thioredoxin-like protein (ISS) [Galdieria sulphuraria]|uniref:Thioredoxin-like protein (ISS) n=1 Tax=Galdieria sulphuraria TaxID=130081 RepID=M2Y176_GALSU|nr:thioredoxin-like protein (ISS) [Galdieria sulphuraria]EME29678.1 thioredoxin-like protein (ISS) [Galdieria sulphuraria]|eukprot:XP_005706198.1 thioredoxin-like protein (ISS) [Galdieria sulphuraria]
MTLWLLETQTVEDESKSVWNVLLEQQIYCIILLVGTVKIFQSPSWEATLSSFFWYCKSGFAILLFYFNRKYCAYYSFLCFVFAFLFLQPRYRGPSNVVQLSRDDFQELVLSSKENRRNIWIVEFYVPWSEQVKTLDSLVAKLSLEYNNDILCFGKLNLASYPDIGMEFGIDTQSSTKVIPTFIVFERGKERQRVPCLDHRGMAVPKEVWRMKKSELVSALQLDHYVFISKMSK